MFHHFRRRPPEDEQIKRIMHLPGRFISTAQAMAHPEPVHWDVPSRTELAEMREAVPHCRRCGGAVVGGECLMCGQPA